LVQFPLDPRDLDTDAHRGPWTNVFRFTNRDERHSSGDHRHLRDERQKARAIVVETQTVYGSSMSVQFVLRGKRRAEPLSIIIKLARAVNTLSHESAMTFWPNQPSSLRGHVDPI